eukprot:CAMPEP_0181295304 /NCGR_PEP_ID=MMETSP1101-20121128/4072_1 /TAXON_ID=46948 /ORGANISM="Rhodomonas abbreviata, Strain Caron Lab Isolate" /LENGTH=573 /DNA_ID=CAMNT_0023400039 /DNA_START=60 /DNA_END=1781 /DNA_ORIENTATION=-
MKTQLSVATFLLLGASVVALDQFTPDQADWSTFQTKPFASGTNTDHSPDGVGWISADSWAASEWDGTIYNPSLMTKSEFSSAMCPSVDRIRGIREVFYQHNPFADVNNPTKAEVDEWHRIALNHIRALIGYTSEDRKVKKDTCMFARSLWGQERRFTTMWDTEYTGTVGSAYGPCQGSSNAHCGATFIPDADDQAAYLPAGHAACTATAGSEGVFSGPKSNIPWSLKWSRGFCNTLMAEGFWGGHVGPFFHREKFGFSFWDNDPNNNNNNAILRAKWTGALMENLYCNPADADCDPNNTGPGPDLCVDPADNNCDDNADCTTTDGSFTCTCVPGFVGDGVTCTSPTQTDMLLPSADGDIANLWAQFWEGTSGYMFATGRISDSQSISLLEFQGVPPASQIVSATLALYKENDISDPQACNDEFILKAGAGVFSDASISSYALFAGIPPQTFSATDQGAVLVNITDMLKSATERNADAFSVVLEASSVRCKAAFATKENIAPDHRPKLSVEYTPCPELGCPVARRAADVGDVVIVAKRDDTGAAADVEAANRPPTEIRDDQLAAVPPPHYHSKA